MEHDESPIAVYKIGGSLFDLPDLFDRLNALFRNERTRPLVVAGGGGAADLVREWDRLHGLGESRSHRLAIQSLSLGAAFLADGLNGTIVAHRESAEATWSATQIPVLDVAAFLDCEVTAGAEPLPASWDVTSDSIAAWVAERWPARLTLVKSASPETALDRYVDPYFATVCAGLEQRVEWINLRGDQHGQLPLATHPTEAPRLQPVKVAI
jgi:aspartokinase-like uncharacterized kinase